jgi:GNAT superfamily N-acetyltransferase
MFKVFIADHTDLDWMTRLYLHAASHGHFATQNTAEGYNVVRKNIFSIVTAQKIVDLNLRAQALVFEKDKDKVGYVVMSEVEPGKGGNEIHLFVVDEKFRGKGYGRLILEEVIRRWHPLIDIYACCFPASQLMATMLTKAGFKTNGKTRDGADMYVLSKGSTIKPPGLAA